MDILILAGAPFAAGHLAQAALARGWRVHWYGPDPRTLPGGVRPTTMFHLRRELPLARLAGLKIDACVDFSAASAAEIEALEPLIAQGCQRYVLVSDPRVYAERGGRPLAEDAHRLLPNRQPDAGPGESWAAREDAAKACFGERATLLRPAQLVGPGDPDGALTWWVERARRGGALLCPAPSANRMQWLDVRDLAGFVLTAIDHELTGEFNLAGPGRGTSWAELIAGLTALAELPLVAHWADPSFLLEHSLVPGQDLPLWTPEDQTSERPSLAAGRALAAGLSVRSLGDTLADILTAIETGRSPLPPVLGLNPEREQRLLRHWQLELTRARRNGVGAEI
jgi:2'-hydroxyisoflavone reductase